MRGNASNLYEQAVHMASYYQYSEVSASLIIYAGLGSLNPVIKQAYHDIDFTYDKFNSFQGNRIAEFPTKIPPEPSEDLEEALKEFFTESHVDEHGLNPMGDVDLLVFLLSRKETDFRDLDFIGLNRARLLARLHYHLDQKTKEELGPFFKDAQVNIEAYCKDISNMAEKGEIDPLIGRTRELERVVQILGRRRKNNPVILGEAGTGKTALVEGIAKAIYEKDPRLVDLHNKRIVELDLHLMLAGTKYRGQFEERLTGLIKELEADPDIIVFVDEVHTVMGAGKVEGGAEDAANILKPSLARGRIQMIGATTIDEYSFIKNDPALERRFQPVELHELADDEILDILEGIKGKYEEFHGVVYTKEALNAVLKLGKELPKRQAPDVQIDLIDEVGSRFKGEKITAKKVKEVFDAQMHSSQGKEKKLGF